MKINEREIVAILDRELRASSGYIGGEIVSRRKRSLEYYLGKPFGNEQEVYFLQRQQWFYFFVFCIQRCINSKEWNTKSILG
jgi:hypothetical protein